MKRRKFILMSASTSLLTACVWPQYFDLAWDEEVRLHDERVIIVRVKYTYERLKRLAFDRYESSILRRTEFSFDAGPPIGRFTQLFDKHRVNLIAYYKGKWYLLFQRRGGLLTVESGGIRQEIFGPIQNGSGDKCWKLDENGFSIASINDLPDEFLKINVLMDNAPPNELAALDGTRVTLDQKEKLLAKYTVTLNDFRIQRSSVANRNLNAVSK